MREIHDRRRRPAISERLGRIRKQRNKTASVKRMLKIGRECAAMPVLDRRKPEVMLYDKNGLPNCSSSMRPHS